MLTTTLLLLATAAPAPGIGVMDFSAEGGAGTELASALSSVVAQELERLQVFHVTSAQTTRVALGVERQRQLLGCDTCSGETLSDITSFEYVVTGKVVKSSGALTLFLTLLPTGKASAASSQQVRASSDSKLLAETPAAVVKLVGKMLEGRQGQLVLTATEVGAAVKVDDVQVGTTPLNGVLKLAAGPHLVSVEKDGFSASRREVRMVADQVSEAHFTLVPSPDTIADYEARASRNRILAIGTAGLAAVGVGLFVVGQVVADNEYGTLARPDSDTFLAHVAKLQAGQETETLNGVTVNHRDRALALKNDIQTWQIVSLTSLAVAGAAAITSVVLFIVGEPPDKYGAFHAGVSLTGNGGAFVFSGSF